MSDLFFTTIERLTVVLARGDLETCERETAKELRALPESPFHLVLDRAISNDPADAAQHFDRFFQTESSRFKIAAAYTEMNGFAINTDRWYCDLFAYSSDDGRADFDWLSGWHSNRFAEYQIYGLEDLQKVHASDAFERAEFDDARYMCDLMIAVKFQRFIHAAAARMKELHFPLYVSAHEYTFIAAVGLEA